MAVDQRVTSTETLDLNWRSRLTSGLPLLAAFATVVLWASAFVGIRDVRGDFSPGALALGRIAVGSFALGLLAARHRQPWPARSDLVPIGACGLLWFGAYNVILNAAEQRLDAGTAAMLINVGPIMIAVLAGVLLREGFPRPLVLGLAVAFAGAVTIGLAVRGDGSSTVVGALLCVLAAALYATAVLLQKGLLTRVPALQVTFLACVAGTIGCLPFTPDLIDGLHATSVSRGAWLVYLGVFPTAVGFTTWAYALARTSAGRLAATTYLVPPLVVAFSWLLLAERPHGLAIAGGALCLVGVAIARRR
jgi:drug/metabolite transporter (DMT)-like permease